MTIAESFVAKTDILRSVGYFEPNLPDALNGVLGEDDDRTLEELSEEDLHSIAPRHDDQPENDTDRGPFEAWCNAHADSTLQASLMFDADAWLRERAYVLWDRDRMQKQFNDSFGEDPGHQADYTGQDYEDMLESFGERSKIWQKGAHGYWSKGDTSRILWSSK